MQDFEESFAWLSELKEPHLLLGNGFSMAFDPGSFGYKALAQRAIDKDLLSDFVKQIISKTGKTDFESIMNDLQSTARTLKALDDDRYADLISQLETSTESLREALAHSIAGLHPDRPNNISDDAYLAVRNFVDRFNKTFTVSYDLLLYWSIMQNLPGHAPKLADDGFRDSGVPGDDAVLWNMYDNVSQSVYYLHGALHLFTGPDGLKKITWIRTQDALIDQVRQQLGKKRFPLYVSEASSQEKLDRIGRSAYLSSSLRSLTRCRHSLMIYGHSLAENDDHILESLVRSKISRIAVSIFGNEHSKDNSQIIQRAKNLVVRRQQRTTQNQLEINFFDASSVPLWS